MCPERIRFINPWPLFVDMPEREHTHQMEWPAINPDADVVIASSRVGFSVTTLASFVSMTAVLHRVKP